MARSAAARTPSECQVRPRVRVLCQLISPSAARSRRAVTMTPRSPVTGTKRSKAMVAAMRSRNSSGSRPGSVQRHRAAPAAVQCPGEGGGLGVPLAPLDLVPSQMGPLILRTPGEGGRTADHEPRHPPGPREDPGRTAGGLRQGCGPGRVHRPGQPARARPPGRTGHRPAHPAIVLRPRQALRWADACCGQIAAQGLQRPRLDPADPVHRDPQRSSRSGVGPRLAADEPQPQLEHPAGQLVQPPQQVPDRGLVGRRGVRVGRYGEPVPLGGRQPVQRRRSLVGQQSSPSTPGCGRARQPPRDRRRTPEGLGQLGLQAAGRPQLLRPAGRDVQRPELAGRRAADVGPDPEQGVGREAKAAPCGRSG